MIGTTGISRRGLLAGAAALAGTTALPGVPRAAATPLGLPIGLQLYSVKDEIDRDVEKTLRAVAAIGYRSVQTNLSIGGWDAKRVSALLKSLGVEWRSCHVSIPELQQGGERLFDQCRELGIERVISAAPFARDTSKLKKLPPDHPLVKQFGEMAASYVEMIQNLDIDDWKWNAEQLNKSGELAKRSGVVVGYHNHNFEFKKFGGVMAYDELLRLTDPALVTLELDCGWMVSAGQDPVDYMARHPGRYSLLHIKDLQKGGASGTGMGVRTTEIGSGTIDWKRIFAAAARAGIKGYYVEQEPPYEKPPLESAKISFDYLAKLSV